MKQVVDIIRVQYIIKLAITVTVIVLASELAKRSSLASAILVSLPLTTMFVVVWRYHDTGSVPEVIGITRAVMLAIPPSLTFFIILPLLLRAGIRFFPSFIITCLSMTAIYWGYVYVLGLFRVKI